MFGIAQAALDAAPSQWDAYSAFFTGIPYGEYISTVFILGLCAFGLIKARMLYKDL